MMVQTYLENSNIISPIGWDSAENLQSVLEGTSGIGISGDRSLSAIDLPLAQVNWNLLEQRFLVLERGEDYTRFEKIGILSILDGSLIPIKSCERQDFM